MRATSHALKRRTGSNSRVRHWPDYGILETDNASSSDNPSGSKYGKANGSSVLTSYARWFVSQEIKKGKER